MAVNILSRKKQARGIFIGINKYEDHEKISELAGAEYDAEHFKNRLEKLGNFTVSKDDLLLGERAKCHEIRRGISDIFWKNEGKYELIVFYFSGHGFVDGYGNGYLAPYDMEVSNPFVYGISMGELRDILEKYYQFSKTGSETSVIMVLDCCYSGLSTDEKGQPGEKFRKNVSSLMGEGRIILASSDSDETSRENDDKDCKDVESGHRHGAFTSLLLKAMDGGTSVTNGILTLGDLQRYIESQSENLKQKPQIELLGHKPLSITLTVIPSRYQSYISSSKALYEQLRGDPQLDVEVMSLHMAAKIIRELTFTNTNDEKFVIDSKVEITNMLKRYEDKIRDWLVANRLHVFPEIKIQRPNDNRIIISKLNSLTQYLDYDQFVELEKDLSTLDLLSVVLETLHQHPNVLPKEKINGFVKDCISSMGKKGILTGDVPSPSEGGK